MGLSRNARVAGPSSACRADAEDLSGYFSAASSFARSPAPRSLRAEIARLDACIERLGVPETDPSPRADAPPGGVEALQTQLAALARKLEAALASAALREDAPEEGRSFDAVAPLGGNTSDITGAPGDAPLAMDSQEQDDAARESAAFIQETLLPRLEELEEASGEADLGVDSWAFGPAAVDAQVDWDVGYDQAPWRGRSPFLDERGLSGGREQHRPKAPKVVRPHSPSAWLDMCRLRVARVNAQAFPSLNTTLVLTVTAIVCVFGGYFAAARPGPSESGPLSSRDEAEVATDLIGPSDVSPPRQIRKIIAGPNGAAFSSFVGADPASAEPRMETGGPTAVQRISRVEGTAGDLLQAPAAPRLDELNEAPAAGLSASTETGPEKLERLAAEGDARAQYELATRLFQGRRMRRDVKAAAVWLGKAADQGLVQAQLQLGILYTKGLGVPRDDGRAREWLQVAAESGDATAMHNLAVLLGRGRGAKSDAAASVWMRKAAQLGVVDSQYNLALLYEQGRGVERDLAQSYAWFSAAAAQGDPGAIRKRKEIGALLDSDQKARAKAHIERMKRGGGQTAEM